MKLSLVSPERNEKAALDELVSRVNAVMSKRFKQSEWEYIIVDDASTDGSDARLQELSKKYKNLRPVFHRERKGQTGCFQTGFEAAKGDFVITMDADLQVLPEDLPLFFDKIDQGYELINAIRENRQHPFWMRFASRCYNILMLLFFNCPVFDACSNFTAIKSSYLKGIHLVDNDHRYLIPIMQKRGVKKIGEVVARHHKRPAGKSKYKALPKYLKGFFELLFAFFRIKFGK
jgi:glycosyltransferase involved in cell wall biosynthesis